MTWTTKHAACLDRQITRLQREEQAEAGAEGREVLHACIIALINLRRPTDEAPKAIIAYSYKAPQRVKALLLWAVASGDNPEDVIVKGLRTIGQAQRRAIREARERGCQAFYVQGDKRTLLTAEVR